RRLPPPCAESSAPSLPDPPPPRRSLGPAGMPRPLERERDRGIRNGGVNVDARAPRMLDPPLGEQDQRGSIEPPRRVVEERKEHRRSEAMEPRRGAIAIHLHGWYVARATELQRGRVTGSDPPSLGAEQARGDIADERPHAIRLQEVDRLIVVDAIPRLEAQVGVCEMGLMTHGDGPHARLQQRREPHAVPERRPILPRAHALAPGGVAEVAPRRRIAEDLADVAE